MTPNDLIAADLEYSKEKRELRWTSDTFECCCGEIVPESGRQSHVCKPLPERPTYPAPDQERYTDGYFKRPIRATRRPR